MPMIDAHPDAIARVYARSLFDLADQRGGQASIEEILAELEDIVELARSDKTFAEFMSSRVVASEPRGRALQNIFAGRVTDLTLRFLQTINEKGRLSKLSAIAAAYDDLTQERFGRIEVDVFTAAPMSAEELAGARARLSERLGKQVVLHPYVDHRMIGGVKFKIGDQLLDASIATSLRRLRDQLDESGAARIRATGPGLLDDAAP